jgi:pyruvate dehydrogenase E2 component (dihydrolipoamide acetyltransferase)
MSDLKEFRLPDVGEGLTEADIIRWHVKPGDTVTVNQIIVEIETAKAVVELPSPYAGTVAGLLVPEGATADVGTPIISVDVGGGPQNGGTVPPADDLVPALPQPEAAEPPEPGAQSVLVGYGVKLGRTTRRTRRTAPSPSTNGGQGRAPAQAPVSAPGPAATTPERGTTDAPDRGSVLAKPPVRKMARDLGVDLSALTGTGPNGSITRDDVQLAAAVVTTEPVPLRPAGSALIPSAGGAQRGAREERIPVRGVRKATAAAMTASAFTAPHVTEFLQIDITETMAATIRLRALPEFEGVRVSPLLLVARALVVAAGRHPMINASWDDAAHEIVIKHYVNLGIAVATERGLIVPNVKDAQALSLPALAQALNQLTGTTRAGKATPADLSGGTITITNVGVFGVDSGTPILTPGEAANLAFGQARQAPWVVDGQLAVRDVCTLALSFDHRIVDGELGSAVLRDVGAMLTDPLRMLAWS